MTKNALFRNTFKEINPNMSIILKKLFFLLLALLNFRFEKMIITHKNLQKSHRQIR